MVKRKKKKAEEVRWKHEKEKEIARRVKAGENRSDIESELESEVPTEVDDMIFSKEEKSQEVVVTMAEHRDLVAMSAGDEQEVERRAEVPMLRKRAASADVAGEREAKRMWSLHPLVASLVSSPPTAGAAEQARWSAE